MDYVIRNIFSKNLNYVIWKYKDEIGNVKIIRLKI